MMNRRLQCVVGVLLAWLVVALGGGGVLSPSASAAKKYTSAKLCRGAAARAPGHHCRLDGRTVTPTPSDAIITPNVECEVPSASDDLERCSYGVPANQAVATVALIGDSHAAHWRSAVEYVALKRHWRVIEFARPLCFFTSGVPNEDFSQFCVGWNQGILAWLTSHPEVRTVFISGNTFAHVTAAPGTNQAADDVADSLTELKALPPSVTSAVVIRDNPQMEYTTGDCVTAALAAHKAMARACTVKRSEALAPDPMVAAARELTPQRAHVVDFTRFFCDAAVCFPVVGGVLTHKDLGHLTQDFVKTLGPYLLTRVATYVPVTGSTPPAAPATTPPAR